LKIATFNVWHGLAGRGTLRFREFESEDRREDRFRSTLRILSELDPDIILLQELNPVSLRGRELTQVLGGLFQGRVDQSGLKLFSHGLPSNLATGLGLIIRGQVRPAREREDPNRMPREICLSGGFGFSGERMSLQVHERRYAQLRSVYHQTFGRLMIVNVHLHHGFERFPELVALLDAAVAAGKISKMDVLRLNEALERARARRLSEVDRLLEVVHAFAPRHDGILIGGDLNSTADGAAYLALRNDGFSDLATSGAARKTGAGGPTWDPIANPENHRIQREVGFDFPLPDFGNPEFTNVYREFDSKPRRIDFLLAKGTLAKVRPANVERFGFPDEASLLAPSDHFGVIACFDSKAEGLRR
jgi:endonuclease/exonuclease/phosphatase family metal-dependent hydrolase